MSTVIFTKEFTKAVHKNEIGRTFFVSVCFTEVSETTRMILVGHDLQHLKETEAVLGANFVYDLRGLCYVHVSIPFCHYLDLIKVLQKCQ